VICATSKSAALASDDAKTPTWAVPAGAVSEALERLIEVSARARLGATRLINMAKSPTLLIPLLRARWRRYNVTAV
jgi:hypothetical protein